MQIFIEQRKIVHDDVTACAWHLNTEPDSGLARTTHAFTLFSAIDRICIVCSHYFVVVYCCRTPSFHTSHPPFPALVLTNCPPPLLPLVQRKCKQPAWSWTISACHLLVCLTDITSRVSQCTNTHTQSWGASPALSHDLPPSPTTTKHCCLCKQLHALVLGVISMLPEEHLQSVTYIVIVVVTMKCIHKPQRKGRRGRRRGKYSSV